MFRTIIAAILIVATTSPVLAYCMRPFDVSDNDKYLLCLINDVSDTVSNNAEIANNNSARSDAQVNDLIGMVKSLSELVQSDANKIAELEARIDIMQNE